jgi:hypothetical protein
LRAAARNSLALPSATAIVTNIVTKRLAAAEIRNVTKSYTHDRSSTVKNTRAADVAAATVHVTHRQAYSFSVVRYGRARRRRRRRAGYAASRTASGVPAAATAAKKPYFRNVTNAVCVLSYFRLTHFLLLVLLYEIHVFQWLAAEDADGAIVVVPLEPARALLAHHAMRARHGDRVRVPLQTHDALVDLAIATADHRLDQASANVP